MTESSTPKLTPKQAKFVKAKIEGKSNRTAALVAGAPTPVAADKYAQRQSNNVQVRQAIEDALKAHGATPEYAVGILKEVADQDKEIGARRLAAKDILELHGWQRGDRPTVSVEIANAFFNQTRQNIIDQTPET
jgi:hypothetical protein